MTEINLNDIKAGDIIATASKSFLDVSLVQSVEGDRISALVINGAWDVDFHKETGYFFTDRIMDRPCCIVSTAHIPEELAERVRAFAADMENWRRIDHVTYKQKGGEKLYHEVLVAMGIDQRILETLEFPEAEAASAPGY